MSPSFLSQAAPSVAVEIGPAAVSGLALVRHGAPALFAGHAVEPLAPGVVSPSLTSANVADPDALARAVAAVLDRLGGRPRFVSLVVPDNAAKVSIVRLDKVPSRADDLEQLIRWHVRKAAPFRLEDAQVTWAPGAAFPDGGREYLVALARRDIVREYEAACEAAGTIAGIVDLDTRKLTLASAGHLPCVMKTGQTATEIPLPGLPLGVGKKKRAMSIKEIDIPENGKLFVYSDGIIEGLNWANEMLGYDSFYKLVADLPDGQACEQDVDDLLSSLKIHAQGRSFEDDVTLLIIDFAKGEPEKNEKEN